MSSDVSEVAISSPNLSALEKQNSVLEPDNADDDDDDDDVPLEREVQHLLDTNDKSCFLVTLHPGDRNFPLEWPVSVKLYHTMIYGITTFCAQFSSSIMAPAYSQIMTDFNVGHTVALLPTSLYVLGIAFGPMLFAPVSELYGRKMSVLVPFFVSILFVIAAGASTRIEAVIITRFFAGLFAGAPVVSSGGVLADIWHPKVRGNSLVLYASFVVLGPTLGSIIGAVITVKTSWKWTCWVSAIVSGVVLTIGCFVINESYVPVLASRKAKQKRAARGNWLYHSKHDEWELTLHEFLTVHMMRPIAMFGTPIVFFIALYASFVFGVFYLFITSAAGTFESVRGWGPIVSSLAYVPMFIGTMIGGGINVYGGKRYARLVNANSGQPLPEERLYPMMTVAWLMPAGLFVFAWTQRPTIHWIAPFFGLGMFGCGFFVIFQGCLNYLVDTYTRYAASAIAANTLLRSIFAATFPLFGSYLFENLKPDWGGTLLALLSLAMLPIPFVFYKFGAVIRKRNPYQNLVS